MSCHEYIEIETLGGFYGMKKSHHLDVTSFLYVFVIWRKKM